MSASLESDRLRRRLCICALHVEERSDKLDELKEMGGKGSKRKREGKMGQPTHQDVIYVMLYTRICYMMKMRAYN